jgi:hypothetical protein
MSVVSLGYGPDGKRIRRKVSGKTKQEVRAKLQALHQERATVVNRAYEPGPVTTCCRRAG